MFHVPITRWSPQEPSLFCFSSKKSTPRRNAALNCPRSAGGISGIFAMGMVSFRSPGTVSGSLAETVRDASRSRLENKRRNMVRKRAGWWDKARSGPGKRRTGRSRCHKICDNCRGDSPTRSRPSPAWAGCRPPDGPHGAAAVPGVPGQGSGRRSNTRSRKNSLHFARSFHEGWVSSPPGRATRSGSRCVPARLPAGVWKQKPDRTGSGPGLRRGCGPDCRCGG